MAEGIHAVYPRVTQSTIYFDIETLCENNVAYKLELYLYDSSGKQIQYAWHSWKALTNGRFFDYSDTLTGFQPFTVFSYVVIFSYRDSGTVIDRASGPAATRIEEFQWQSNISTGAPIRITALEWNDLLDKCEEASRWVGSGSFGLSYVKGLTDSPDNPDYISAYAYNYILDIFANKLGYKAGLKRVLAGTTPITAQLINALETAINQVIRSYDYLERPDLVTIE